MRSITSTNPRLNACVGTNGGPAGFDRYAEGYFEAGNRLVQSLHDDPWDVDLLVYPIVLAYRHGIETALKYLVTTTSRLCDTPLEPKLTHKLKDNWVIVMKGLRHLSVPAADLLKADKLINDILKLDHSGECFRYPIARDGSLHLQDVRTINLEHLGANMAWLGKLLVGCCEWTYYELQCKWEAEWYARQEATAQFE